MEISFGEYFPYLHHPPGVAGELVEVIEKRMCVRNSKFAAQLPRGAA